MVFDVSAEYPFLLQDVLADRSISSRLILDTSIDDAEQLHKVIVKPRTFEKDLRSRMVFNDVISQGKVGCYVEPQKLVPTFDDILNQVKAMRETNLDKPTYVDALEAIRRAATGYMREHGFDAGDSIDEGFVDCLDSEANRRC